MRTAAPAEGESVSLCAYKVPDGERMPVARRRRSSAGGVAEKAVVELEEARRRPRGGPGRVVGAYADACGVGRRVIWGAAIARARAVARARRAPAARRS